MDTEVMDTLVRLASIGASGISVLAIFWIGVLLRRPAAGVGPEWHKTVRLYMVTCVSCALIAGASGVANAKYNHDRVVSAEDQNARLKDDLVATQKTLVEVQAAAEKITTAPQWRSVSVDAQLKTSTDVLERFSTARLPTTVLQDAQR